MRPKPVMSSRRSGWDRFDLEQKLVLAAVAAILLLLILTRLGIASHRPAVSVQMTSIHAVGR